MTNAKTIAQLVEKEIINFEWAPEARKNAFTLARKARKEEVGTIRKTFVLRNWKVEVEGEKPVTNDSIILRNPTPIAEGVYNERPIEPDSRKNNYWDAQATEEFAPFQKINTIKLVKITQDIADAMWYPDWNVRLTPSWWETEMTWGIGDYLVDGWYILNAREFENTYTIVWKKELKDVLQ